ncbi:tRNA (adenosine(37)-N6)-threonylcarbamoyltransferase complex dimerization subunit type 1 TsaB [Ideonella sp. 4Y16]|uniref:tRNA (Adenosine(37)-N6)-threonylcarbamoyltransferase complex dimerization subunit type 1 TsaB n=1 Tax=Ideonella alba TaxID=2824118 RepID=A0A940Y751_9BURK|nr:tRNA (adenosine(37)-N6)-threonylcarbamoyltransferase complex dimerization subunit type 1 TsaB [Ideonella alba]MBQ0930013.1 tRNA (adenosine(37)-N6)-threonylcarbamoyltransferase complex dimerization subunit type 1 TsaB [Ideonella alba]MBQ0946073.1 tRNA (adenosine(37)-N6)-threonylcarbamoyltransferase complex dimerization subunit type 1 TsaB [Ideonella alba]
MRLLALDTATEALAVALADGAWGRSVNASGGAQASATLLPQLLDLLAQRGLAPADLQGIACGQGPGAFTGLRTAVSVAQGLALGIGCPVWLLDSLLIVAEDARRQADQDDGFALWVAMDARMDEVYAGHYRRQGGRWQVLRAPALYDLPTLATLWTAEPPPACAGSALDAFGERLALGAARRWPQQADRAAALLALARETAQQSPGVAPDQALPLYLRDKVALTTAEREALKAGSAA